MTPQKAQKLQNEIYRKMSADRKIEIASQLWQLGRELSAKGGSPPEADGPRAHAPGVKNKNHGDYRSPKTSDRGRKDSQ